MTAEIAVIATVEKDDGTELRSYCLIKEKFKTAYDNAVADLPNEDGVKHTIRVTQKEQPDEDGNIGYVCLKEEFDQNANTPEQDQAAKIRIGRILAINPNREELDKLEQQYGAFVAE